jgi:hypothetical protein
MTTEVSHCSRCFPKNKRAVHCTGRNTYCTQDFFFLSFCSDFPGVNHTLGNLCERKQKGRSNCVTVTQPSVFTLTLTTFFHVCAHPICRPTPEDTKESTFRRGHLSLDSVLSGRHWSFILVSLEN